MIVRHSVLHKTSRIPVPLFSFSTSHWINKVALSLLFTVLCIGLIPSGFANPDTPKASYGPIKAGQTLWDIAEETRSDDSISIEQIVYALYTSNPEAFQSGNMNLLQKGALLQIPDNEQIAKTNDADAKKQLGKHVHALDVLRVDAKHLRTAKANTRKHKKRIKALQKRLGKYRYETRDWNSTYLKLVKAKRNYKKSKRNVAKLHGLLLEKATLKYTKPSKKEVELAATNETNERLSQIQSSLVDLNQSNAALTEKVNELASLNQRVKVLEEELGKNDELVLQLQETLKTVQEAIQQQTLENKKYQQRFEELSALKSKLAQAETKANKPIAEEKSEKDQVLNQSSPEKAPPAQNVQSKEKEIVAETIQEETNDLSFSPDEYTRMQALKAGFNPSEIEPVALTSKAKLVADEESPKLSGVVKKLANYQPSFQKPASTDSGMDSWLQFLKDKMIIIGGLLNGLILIFVIFRLMANKQTSTTMEDFDSNNSNNNDHKSWQERENPKL